MDAPTVGTFWKRVPHSTQPVRVVAVINDGGTYIVLRYRGGFPFIEALRDFHRHFEACPPAKSHRAAIVAMQQSPKFSSEPKA